MVVMVAVGSSMLAQSPADDAAIRGIVKSYIDARDRDDAKGVEALFTSDADQLVSSGEWRKGRDEVVKGTLASTRSGGKRTITIETIRHIAPGVAIADGRYELVGDAQTRRHVDHVRPDACVRKLEDRGDQEYVAGYSRACRKVTGIY